MCVVTKNRKKWNKIEKVMAFQNRGVINSKNKPPNATKAGPQTPTKILICLFDVVKFQR